MRCKDSWGYSGGIPSRFQDGHICDLGLVESGKDFRIKRIALAQGLSAALFAGRGCKKQRSESDAIRAGMMQHLTGAARSI